MALPNFLIVGAAKAATSSIFNYLIQHPDVYGPAVKEPAFFAFENKVVDFKGPGDSDLNRTVITNIDDYQSLFNGVKNEKAIGEASVVYLYNEQAVYRIRRYIPDVKIIVILRNPVDRAISSYRHLRRDDFEPLMTLEEALEQEGSRRKNNWQHLWHYAEMGYYYESLKRYYDQFPEKNIMIFTYDEFKKSPLQVLANMFKFLEVDVSFVPETSYKYNMAGVPKSKILHKFLRGSSVTKDLLKKIIPTNIRQSIKKGVVRKNMTTEKIEISGEVREFLKLKYKSDILKTQNLVKKDLMSWLE